MQSKYSIKNDILISRAKDYGNFKWSSLTDNQRTILKKFWGILTYKWRWQLAMNIPYLAIFILHNTVQSVHEFDVNLLENISANIPLPDVISSWLGIG